MEQTFASVVDSVQQLSYEEQSELRNLLEKYIVEKRREQIRKNGINGMLEYERGELTAYTNVDDLMAALDD